MAQERKNLRQSVKAVMRNFRIGQDNPPESLDPEPEYETGGFDIMKQLVKKQRRKMDVRKAE